MTGRLGIINLHFQLGDSKLRTDAAWPIDEGADELSTALALVDHVLEQSKSKAVIVDLYHDVRFSIVRRYIDLYNQSALGGAAVTAQRLREWQRLYRDVEIVLNVKSGWRTKLAAAESGGLFVNDEDISRWTSVKIETGALLNASLSLALSSILLAERTRNGVSQACAVARLRLENARGYIETYAKDQNFEKDPAIMSQFNAFVQQVEDRIAVSC
jgi:hypothetical protein